MLACLLRFLGSIRDPLQRVRLPLSNRSWSRQQEGYCVEDHPSVRNDRFIIFIDWGLVNANALSDNHFVNLWRGSG